MLGGMAPPDPALLAARRRLIAARRARLHARHHPSKGPRIAVVLVLGFLAMLGGGAEATSAMLLTGSGPLPAARTFNADSLVVDRHGRLIAEMHPPGETRLPVPLSQVSRYVQEAIVDVEDRNFWNEGPVDMGRIAAAAWDDLNHHGSLQGASTIPMQLAKVLYLNDTRTLAYKVQQVSYAGHLVSSESKQQILEDYLNDIFFGNGATGIQAAAHVFFATDAGKLDLAQASMLAGLPNQPSTDNPTVDAGAAQARQRVVLQAMVDAADITPAQRDAALAEKLSYADGRAEDTNLYPAFMTRVAQQISDQLHLDPYRAGLSITTTLDSTLQDSAQQIVAAQVSTLGRLHVTDGALVSMDPQSGDVVAYVGSAGPGVPGGLIDMAATPRQPGSTFKLFTYSTAFATLKTTMVSPVADTPLVFPTGGGSDGMQPWAPKDYDLKWHGVVPVAVAFANSLNIPAIRTEMLAGIPTILATARRMGVTTLTAPDSSYGPSMTLGSYPVPLWEMAQAATTFAAAGTMHPARFVTSVKQSGHELWPQTATPGVPALDPGAAYIVNTVLTNDRNREMEYGAHGDLTLNGHLVSAKTGTTQDFRDNLTIGWTPHLVTATWVGNTDNSPMQGTTGITGAAPIWHQYMTAALAGISDDWPAPPADVHAVPWSGGPAYVLNGSTPQPMPPTPGAPTTPEGPGAPPPPKPCKHHCP